MEKFAVMREQQVGRPVICQTGPDIAWMGGGQRMGNVQKASYISGSGTDIETWEKEQVLHS